MKDIKIGSLETDGKLKNLEENGLDMKRIEDLRNDSYFKEFTIFIGKDTLKNVQNAATYYNQSVSEMVSISIEEAFKDRFLSTSDMLTMRNESHPSPYYVQGLLCKQASIPSIYDIDDNENIDEIKFFKGLGTGLILSAILWIGIFYLVVK